MGTTWVQRGGESLKINCANSSKKRNAAKHFPIEFSGLPERAQAHCRQITSLSAIITHLSIQNKNFREAH